PTVAAAPAATAAPGQALLATWHELLDAGRLQDGDEHLAGTARPARAILNAATAAEVGVQPGGHLALGTPQGTLVLPVEIGHAADRVVWVATNSPGRAVRPTLGVGSGGLVTLTNADAPPVIGAGGDS
ncbi:MAG: NADH-quinone oxidoreductase subunit G, partial [Actinomycetota bacterium]|nr:NADH-quinone oxidoreductase subunit G [Actinomycetota bacterium]